MANALSVDKCRQKWQTAGLCRVENASVTFCMRISEVLWEAELGGSFDWTDGDACDGEMIGVCGLQLHSESALSAVLVS